MFKHGSISNTVSFFSFDIINEIMKYRGAMANCRKI